MFATTINCMDGRTQLPVILYLQKKWNVEYVDSITEPGPIKFMAEQPDSNETKSIFTRLSVSVNKHKSVGLAIVAHYDCTGNPVSKERQLEQLADSISLVKKTYPDLNVIGVWVDENWVVEEVC